LLTTKKTCLRNNKDKEVPIELTEEEAEGKTKQTNETRKNTQIVVGNEKRSQK
jgi:hypothetical protein